MKKLRIGLTRKVSCPVCHGSWKFPDGTKCPSCRRGYVREVTRPRKAARKDQQERGR